MLAIFCCLLCGIAPLFSMPIPQEEGLVVSKLPSGVTVWTKENVLPSHMVSYRVVWKKDELPTVYALDCPAEDEDEIEDFFEFCLSKIECSPSEVAVIGVGDCSCEDMERFIQAGFRHMPGKLRGGPQGAITIEMKPELGHVDLALMYPTRMEKLETLGDLRRQWTLYFLQSLVQGRMERSLRDSRGVWLQHREAHFLLPKQFCYAKARAADTNILEVLGGFLLEIQEIRKRGFEEEELSALKEKVQRSLISLYHKVPSSGTLATYYADQSSLGMGCPSYAFFMEHSLEMVSAISLREIHELVMHYLVDPQRQVALIGPPSMKIDLESIQEVLSLFSADAFILDLNHPEPPLHPGPEVVDAYTFLPITVAEEKLIWEIIDTIATNNPIALGFKATDLEKKGKKIDGVHPLRFLGTIFSNPHLKLCMQDIRTSYFKWDAFIANLSRRAEQEYMRNNLLPYVVGFSQAVKVNPEPVKLYIQKRDWEGLVKYLLKPN